MLLLFLLLHHDLVFKVAEVLKDVGVEQRHADVVEPGLQPIQIVVQPGVEDFINGAELQFRDQPAREFFRVVAKLPLGEAGDFAEGVIG